MKALIKDKNGFSLMLTITANQNHDLMLCTWNASTLIRQEAPIQLTDALNKFKADITAIKEILGAKGKA